MKRSVITFMIHVLALSAFGQDISREQANALLHSLSRSRMADTGRMRTLLQLAEFNIFKPGQYAADLDSAAGFLREAERINIAIKSRKYDDYIILVRSCLVKESGDPARAQQLLDSVIRILTADHEYFLLGKAYFQRAQYYDYNDPQQIQTKIMLTEQSLAAFNKAEVLERKAYLLQYLGNLYSLNNENSRALDTLKKAVDLYTSIHYPAIQGVYDQIGYSYYNQKNLSAALRYSLLALQTGVQVHDSTMQLCEINNHIGLIYMELKEFDHALIYLKNALGIAETYHDREAVYLLAENISNCDLWLQKFADALSILEHVATKYPKPQGDYATSIVDMSYLNAFVGLRQFHQAQFYSDRLLGLIRANHLDDGTKTMLYGQITKFYISSRQDALANKYLPVHAALCRKIGNPVAIKYNIRLQFMLDSAEGHYKAAMFHLQQYHQINDSLFNETKSKQFKQAEVEYETEKKENDLKLRDRDIRLLKQENLLQQGRLQQADLIKNVTIGSIAMLFVIMGLLYRQYLIKQKSNRLITEKNELLQHLLAEKEWLLKEVHHRVKNNLHTVICLLESQAANLESDALSEMENTQHRIYAMSLIHQKLYQSEDLKTIDMSIFLPDLMRYMKDGLDGKRRIHFRLDIAPVKLGVAQAIPIALIINEAVTNAIKYAFVGREGGLIELSMCQENDQVALQINDNGIGIDPAIVHAPSDSLGLKLIHGLSEDINASIHIENESGTKIRVVFDLDPLNDPALYESKKTQMKVSQ